MIARASFVVVACCCLASITVAQPAINLPVQPTDPLAWPEATQSARPWTRWWWLGSAVDEANITRLLETYKAAGIGGVEITSIYGVKGTEDRVRPFLSDSWKAAVAHTLREAKRLGMGVDLPTGSGWRSGGPSVSEEDGNRQVVLRSEEAAAGSSFERDFKAARPQAVVAYGPGNKVIELTDTITADGKLSWQVPAGNWMVYTLSQEWSRDIVKRPAPGGEGRNINPYSRRSLDHFLDYFGDKLGDLPAQGIRSQFHDSFEYEGNWCDEFLAEFEKRRGYRLQQHLPALAANMGGAGGRGRRGGARAGAQPNDATSETAPPAPTEDEIARVKHDYRETLSDLVLDNLIIPWRDWSHAHGMLARNQSHGSPANWLDLYGAVDIPETESFGRLNGGDGHPLVFKFASSAAHVMGRPLVSSETCTWLDEHYHETLGDMKTMVDRLFLAGINHVIFHGTAYSPQEAAWPGWLFYASTELNPQNPIWRDLPALNAYITRCQSMFQSTKPDNDILLYWPIHDQWQNPAGLRMNLQVHNATEWLLGTDFGRTAQWLDEHGYLFDYISDGQIAQTKAAVGRVQTPGGTYRVILAPKAKTMPVATLQKLVSLAEAGATIVFQDELPSSPSGLNGASDRGLWGTITSRIESQRPNGSNQYTVNLGAGKIVVAADLYKSLDDSGARREPYHKLGKPDYEFQRRTWQNGHVYFVHNQSKSGYGGYVGLGVDWDWAILMDPMTGETGFAQMEIDELWGRRLLLPLYSGQTLFVKTFRGVLPERIKPWPYERSGFAIPIPLDKWSVEFIAGGPELPPPTTVEAKELENTDGVIRSASNGKSIASWTKFAGAAGERFAGTARYSTTFIATAAGKFELDLGKVADSARVFVNDKLIATLITSPYTVNVELQAGENRIGIEVTNVAANRIRDLDRRGVQWKIFKDINIVNINYRPLDASQWPIRDAGLLGPVVIFQPTKSE